MDRYKLIDLAVHRFPNLQDVDHYVKAITLDDDGEWVHYEDFEKEIERIAKFKEDCWRREHESDTECIKELEAALAHEKEKYDEWHKEALERGIKINELQQQLAAAPKE